jgi:hypothetical protein
MSTNLDDRPPTPFPGYNENVGKTQRNVLNTISEESGNVENINTQSTTMSEIKINKKSNLFIKSYNTLKHKIKDIDISATTIISILKASMELVEQLEDVKGTEQREFAVLLVREIIDKSNMSPSQKESCLLVIDFGVLDNVVDFVIDASNGNLDINKVKKKVSGLFSCCK